MQERVDLNWKKNLLGNYSISGGENVHLFNLNK